MTQIFRLLKLSFLFLSLFLLSTPSEAANENCGTRFAELQGQSNGPITAFRGYENASNNGIRLADSNLWNYTVKWELTHNFSTFLENPETRMLMDLIKTNADEVEVIRYPGASDDLVEKFVKDGDIYWPLHPNNTEVSVPFFGKDAAGTLETRYTASRSLFTRNEDGSFTVKAGTNYPHKSEMQSAKAFTKDDVDGALLRQPFINEMAKILPPDDTLITLPEVLILKHKATGEGVLIRDLSALDNENIYVTGLSIPYVGREIATKNGAEFGAFWQKAYSENLGKAKARLLINYGIEMETPNSQNIIIELNKHFQPTGKVVLRDTVDSYTYEPWLRALNMKNVKAENVRLGYEPKLA
jgi:hypothetical protein